MGKRGSALAASVSMSLLMTFITGLFICLEKGFAAIGVSAGS